MTYEWLDKEVTLTSTWSNAVRNAMLTGAAEWHRKKILRKAAGKWSNEFCRVTETQDSQGLKSHQVRTKHWTTQGTMYPRTHYTLTRGYMVPWMGTMST